MRRLSEASAAAGVRAFLVSRSDTRKRTPVGCWLALLKGGARCKAARAPFSGGRWSERISAALMALRSERNRGAIIDALRDGAQRTARAHRRLVRTRIMRFERQTRSVFTVRAAGAQTDEFLPVPA